MATRFLHRFRPLFAAMPYLSRPALSLSSFPLLPLRPFTAVSAYIRPSPTIFSTLETSSEEWYPEDGCDFEHWLVVIAHGYDRVKRFENVTREDLIDSYIKILAQVVGKGKPDIGEGEPDSEEVARMKIYSVSTKHYLAFGALVTEDLAIKLRGVPGVQSVLPDSYQNVERKDYGKEPFINGHAVAYDPKYHEEWVKNNPDAYRRNDRPGNDSSGKFEQRSENMRSQNQGSEINQGGPNSSLDTRSPSEYQNMGAPSQYPNMQPNMGLNYPMQNNDKRYSHNDGHGTSYPEPKHGK